ncbi:MFS transporter [Enterococcus asini]|uniref:MFS transporter n=1 Tax=Enterococcus asini TaxID=57732 RepID=UPI000E522105|nr:MFS transporter [Enterococcus asini]RGW10551.1 MFS transporter [Enterococcus asini]
MEHKKIGLKEKLAYASVNFGNIPIMTVINGYLLIFYTNICGLDPAACATLFLIARILDGLNDPLVGYAIDHLPNTRFGRFRPPLIVGTILCSLNFLLLWFGPMLATSGKLIIAYISYLLIGLLFPIMDISLNSLLPVMTTDIQERNTLSSIKGVVYAIGALGFGVAAPLILGNVSNRQGYVKLILIATTIIFIFSIIGTLGVKERVKPQTGKRYGIKELFKFLGQKPVYITFITVLLFTIGNNIVSTINTFFYTYIMGSLELLSIATLVTCATLIFGTVLVGRLAVKHGKKKMFLIGLAIVGFASIIRLIDVRSVPLLILSSSITGIGSGFASPLIYGIQADNTDYIELKMNQRAEGAVASLSSFVSKCAAGIGGAIPGYLLTFAKFDSAASVQSEGVHTVIILCALVIPTIIYFIGVVIFGKGYPITKEELEKQNELLTLRRSKDF